jgi:hypothetical protein
VTAKALGHALGTVGRIVDATVRRNPSRRVKSLTLTSLWRGSQRTASVGGAATASALGLRSSWFSVGVLSLQPPSPNPAVAPGTRVRLSGVVRGVRGVVVQRRSSGGTSWKRLRAVASGPFHFTVKPKVTTQYRLATAQDAAAFVRIRVGAGTVK